MVEIAGGESYNLALLKIVGLELPSSASLPAAKRRGFPRFLPGPKTPGLCCAQERLEEFDGMAPGKYTKGLGQEGMRPFRSVTRASALDQTINLFQTTSDFSFSTSSMLLDCYLIVL